jgi:hypothetical protein
VAEVEEVPVLAVAEAETPETQEENTTPETESND